MCGIVGFTHRNYVASPTRIKSAVDSLIHRGPDEQGVYRSRFVSLGSTRLKIIDLDAGRQPMISEDGDTVLVFNGEIYNHDELRRELQQLGHRFISRSDTEVILRGFQQWDTGCFERLRGMFALALWTESKKRLVLARDRLGIKPLYICRRHDDLLFGSELKAILVHPEVERRMSLPGLNCYLSLNYVPSPWTLVDGIEKLPPGHFLEWIDGEVRVNSYWRLAFRERPDWTEDSAKERLDSLLRESIREHMISDVPLGVWLSGGVDSSTILHYAAEQSSSRLKTFSISFSGRSFDESGYARSVAERYGTEHHELDLNPDVDLADAIEEFAYYSDEPSADSGALPVWFLSRMSREKVTVALSGEGADELFGGYLTYSADRLARVTRCLPAGTLELGLGWLRRWPVSDEKIGLEYKAKRFLEGSLLPAGEAHLYWNGTFSKAQKETLLRGADHRYLRDVLRQLPRPSASLGELNRFLFFDQICYLPDDILYKSDRMSMAHSLEVRPPFLDHRLVEFAASLPERFKLRGFKKKYLLNELMKEKLPASVIRRKKIGLDVPTHDWLRGPLRPLLEDALAPDAVAQSGLFRPEVVQSFIRRHLERRENLGFHLWGLMILFLWIRKWQIQPTPYFEARGEALERVLPFS
ncbi:MAG TPA: asparagine synthase (glutamine-hydrolyzing) [Candidatus Dormibacteraeota bacterium]|nr:asparagine synthase (glutamine-hydrolyzing) [Candidatus Dormibacteraeota bacterium]